MIDRRKYPRFTLKLDAKYEILSLKEALKCCSITNVSAEGVCFEAEEKIGTGSNVKLEVDLGDKKSPVFLFGEIMWSQELRSKGPKKKVLNGVRLMQVPKTDEARVLKYYCDRMVEKLSGYLKM